MIPIHPGRLFTRIVIGACAVLATQVSSHAFVVNHANTVPGVVANSLIANGNGADWQTGELLMVLTAGSVYNDPTFDQMSPQQNVWGVFPDLEFDSWVGIPGDGGSIAGGATDLGDNGPAVIAGQKVSVVWYNSNPANTSSVRIANISLTDNAQGTFTVIAGFSPNVILRKSGWVVDGVAYFEIPGDLDKDGFVGINDLNIVLSSWNQAVTPNAAADPSGDGFVGIEDLNQVLGFWNKGTPPTAGAVVPEPASLGLMMLAGGACLRRRTR